MCRVQNKSKVENNFMYNDNTLFLCHSLYLLYIIINANKNYVGAVLVHLIRIVVNFLLMIFFFSLYLIIYERKTHVGVVEVEVKGHTPHDDQTH